MSGCVHKDVQRADTDSNAPPNITQEVTTVCSIVPMTTVSTVTDSTRTQTTITTTTHTKTIPIMTSMVTTTTVSTKTTPDIFTEDFFTEYNIPTEIESYIEPVCQDMSCLPITESERVMLCNLVGREYGSDYVPISEKAKVVAVVMNRVNSPLFPNTIYEVLTQPYQFSGYVASDVYSCQVTDSVIESVNYYFGHTEEFGDWLYFEGDGTWNYFS